MKIGDLYIDSTAAAVIVLAVPGLSAWFTYLTNNRIANANDGPMSPNNSTVS